MDSIVNDIKQAWFIIGSALLLLFILDFFLRKLLALKFFKLKTYSSLDGTLLDAKPTIPESYQNQHDDWFIDYIHEAKWVFNHIQWRSYTYWCSKQFQGKYININHKGIRKTSGHPSLTENDITIYVFGGSTVWGWGARDNYTIPSCIAQQLEDEYGIRAKVINFGELGYVSTQGLICLIRELQQQRKPDIVVTYDGLNDSFLSYQLGRAGLVQNEPNREREFNQTLSRHFKNFISTKSGFYQLKHKLTVPPIASINTHKSSKLAKDTVATYLTNIKILNALASNINFKLFAYWQPTLFDKKILSSAEKVMYNKQDFWHHFYLKIKQQIKQQEKISNFYCLSDIFIDYPEPAFIDPWHVDETANKYIAARISGDIFRYYHP
jgi:lysophospholipase L1-like esterase